MAIQPKYPPKPSSHETKKPGDLIPINDEIAQQRYNQERQELLASFRALFVQCRGTDAPRFCLERRLELVLEDTIHEDGFRFTRTVIVLPFMYDGLRSLTEYDSGDEFEVGEHETDRLYGSRVRSRQTYPATFHFFEAGETIKEGYETLEVLLKAASDPLLNPHTAQNIQDVLELSQQPGIPLQVS